MPVVVGNQLTLSIAGVGTFTPQVLTVSLTSEPDRQVLESLSGPIYKTVEIPYTLDFTMLADWGAYPSLLQTLADLALDADDRDTSIGFTMTVVGATHTTTIGGNVFPEVPSAGGEGAVASQVTLSLTGDPNTNLTVATTSNP